MRLEAEAQEGTDVYGAGYRNDTMEVHLYSLAMRRAQKFIEDGAPISEWLIKSFHKQLLVFSRAPRMLPGEYKKEQNYLADGTRRKILFVPISPEQLEPGMQKLIDYLNDSSVEPLIKAAIAHLEFEALHPFNDGNGGVGRIIIPLMLWKNSVISQPGFYMSEYLEKRRDEYIDLLRNVSAKNDWTSWVVFFLEAIEAQAKLNLEISERIKILYEKMKEDFRTTLTSQWSTLALDFVFKQPVFRNSTFTAKSGIPLQTAHRISKLLFDRGYLVTIEPASGRRSAIYAFEPLLLIIRN